MSREALLKSIEHWRAIADGEETDQGDLTCALCREYHPECHLCPIGQETGQCFCRDTPYKEWWQHQNSTHNDDIAERKRDGNKVRCETCRELALEELAFLMRLLLRVPGDPEAKAKEVAGECFKTIATAQELNPHSDRFCFAANWAPLSTDVRARVVERLQEYGLSCVVTGDELTVIW